MVTIPIDLEQLQVFFLVLVRVAAILMSMPGFSGGSAPVPVKAGLVLAVSWAVFPALGPMVPIPADSLVLLGLAVAGEVLLGAAIGLTVQMIFAGVQIAGELAGYQMGMAVANVLDPDSSVQIPLLSQFFQMFAILIFFSVNAHHWFVKALVESFHLLPPLRFHVNASLMDLLVNAGGAIFVSGVRLGAPVIVVLLLTSLAFGLLARTVPQMNVFVVAIPLKIAVGLLFMAMSLPYVSAVLQSLFFDNLRRLLVLLANGF
jgi:flagellar biosynthetic protein FliR